MSDSSDVQAKVLLQLPNVQLHRLTNKTRNQFTSGVMRVCELQKPNKDKVYFLNLNSFYYTIGKQTIFIKVQYKKHVSYVYPHFDTGLSSVTIELGEANIGKFQEILMNAATLVSYNQAIDNPILKEKILTHCPDLEQNQIVVSDKLQHAINVGGQYAEIGFKWLGGMLSSGVNMIGGYFGEKVEHTGPTENSEKTKSTWNDIKEGTGKFITVSGGYISAVVDPVLAKGKEVVGSIGEKIDQSESEKVKYLKEIGATTAGAMKQAFTGVVQAVSEVGTSVSNTTKEIWEKKYGGEEIHMNQPAVGVGSAPADTTEKLSENIEINKPQVVRLNPKDSINEPLLGKQEEKPLYPDIQPGPTMK